MLSFRTSLVCAMLACALVHRNEAAPQEWTGLYRGADGARLIVFPSPVDPSLPALVELESGRVRALFPGGEDAYTFGPALGLPEPVEGAILFERSEAGELAGLRRLRVTGTGEPDDEGERFARAGLRFEPLAFAHGEIELAGTLVLPEGTGPFPALVLLHGSGPEPREANFGMALAFAAEGYATLCFDKRGTGRSSGADWQASLDDYAGDAEAAFRALRARQEIDAARAGFWGHSQGAWVAALAASRTREAAFVVLECGGALAPVETELWWSRRLLEEKTALGAAEVDAALEYRRKKFDVVAGRMSAAELEPFTARAREASWFPHVTERLPDGRFWEANAAYDPEPALEGLGHCPVLALFAEADDSTPTEPSARAARAALERSGHEHFRVQVIPDANHGFFETKTGKRMEEELPALDRFAPGYPSVLMDWLAEVTRR